jgi:DNA-binding CsgD family transcriptional regulator
LLPVLDAPGLDRLGVMMLARRAVLQASTQGGGLLVVDDAHLLDDVSAALVHQLAMADAVDVLVTVRSGEPAPDAVVALWKDGWLECLDLQPLDRVALGTLAGGLLAGSLDPPALARVWELTRGNALLCRELVRAAVAAGVLVRERDVWRWRGTLPGAGRVWDLIEARFSELDPGALAALEAIAVADGADDMLLEGLVDPAARAGLLRRGLLEEQPHAGRSVLRLAHPLFGEALRARMPAARRRELCGQLADAGQARGLAGGPELLRVASWRLEQGGGGEPALLVAAARRAEAGFDPRLAERLARAALAAGAGFDADRELAIALGAQGDLQAAEEIFARLEREASSDAQRATVGAQWSELLFLAGRSADAAVLVGRVAGALEPGWLRDELRVLEANWAWLSGDQRESARVQEWLSLGERSERMRMLVAFVVAPMQVVAGRIQDALATLDGCAEAATRWREGLPTVELALRSTRTYALWSAGRLGDDLSYCEREWTTAVTAGELEPAAIFGFTRGGALTDIGRVDSAIGALEDASTLLEQLDLPLYLSWSLAFLARALALAGDAPRAREALERAERARPAQIRLPDAELGSARVWLAVAEGDIAGARTLALALADEHAARGRPVDEARALHDTVRLGGAREVGDRLAELQDATDAPVVAVFADHVTGLLASDGPRLAAAGERFQELGCTLWAAEAHASAAAAFASAGRNASSRSASARSGALLRSCEGARTPALIDASVGAALTSREMDVVLLAAHGLANREIAQKLVLSIRTVESHLAQSYRKLGASNRTELAGILGEGNPPT